MVVHGEDRSGSSDASVAGQGDGGPSRRVDLEVVSAVILAVVTIITAWSAFQATKWVA